jgi:hypothetical protein
VPAATAPFPDSTPGGVSGSGGGRVFRGSGHRPVSSSQGHLKRGVSILFFFPKENKGDPHPFLVLSESETTSPRCLDGQWVELQEEKKERHRTFTHK